MPVQKPATAYVDAFKCARGLAKIVVMGGREDGFNTDTPESARIHPSRLPNPYLETIRDAQSGMMTLRDYDEGGADKLFIDYFDVPRGLVSAQLVLVQKGIGDQDYDGIRFGDFKNLKPISKDDRYSGLPAFSYSFKSNKYAPVISEQRTGLLVLDMAVPAFQSGAATDLAAAPEGRVLDYLNTTARPDVLDVQVQDDTIIDVVALVGCQKPVIAKGTSFVEFSKKPNGTDVSFLSCQSDQSEAPCNPFQGDQTCDKALPLACYKPSPAPAPKVAGITNMLSGNVKPSNPVVGAQLPTLASANATCARQFGEGWRVLNFHDGDFNGVITKSQIAPRTRLWIDVRNQQYANCWDRDMQRGGQ